jgi:hypothetical protein
MQTDMVFASGLYGWSFGSFGLLTPVSHGGFRQTHLFSSHSLCSITWHHNACDFCSCHCSLGSATILVLMIPYLIFAVHPLVHMAPRALGGSSEVNLGSLILSCSFCAIACAIALWCKACLLIVISNTSVVTLGRQAFATAQWLLLSSKVEERVAYSLSLLSHF